MVFLWLHYQQIILFNDKSLAKSLAKMSTKNVSMNTIVSRVDLNLITSRKGYSAITKIKSNLQITLTHIKLMFGHLIFKPIRPGIFLVP